MSKLYDTSVDLIRRLYDSRISAPPVLQCEDYFPQSGLFQENWEAIRKEALSVAGKMEEVPCFHELMQEQEDISDGDNHDWRIFVLKAYGKEFEKNMVRCPLVAELIRSSPDVLGAAFSFLSPGKHIPVHRGPFRGIVRYHLGLSVPFTPDGKPGAGLMINDQEYLLRDGECLLWDDTYPHEAWNHSQGYRAALLMDIRRRHLPLDMELFSRMVIAGLKTVIRFKKVA